MQWFEKTVWKLTMNYVNQYKLKRYARFFRVNFMLSRKKLRFVCINASRSQKLYLLGVFTLILFGIGRLIQIPEDVSLPMVWLGIGMLMLGVVSDATYVYEYLWENTIGKGLILVSYAVISTISYGYSFQVVNAVVEYPIGNLVSITVLSTFLLIPFFLFIASLFLYPLSILLLLVYETLKPTGKNSCFSFGKNNKQEKFSNQTFIFRVVIYTISWIFIIYGMQTYSGVYSKFISNGIGSYLYNIEAIDYSRCVISECIAGRVIELTNGEMLLAQKLDGEYWFQPMKCIPVLDN